VQRLSRSGDALLDQAVVGRGGAVAGQDFQRPVEAVARDERLRRPQRFDQLRVDGDGRLAVHVAQQMAQFLVGRVDHLAILPVHDIGAFAALRTDHGQRARLDPEVDVDDLGIEQIGRRFQFRAGGIGLGAAGVGARCLRIDQRDGDESQRGQAQAVVKKISTGSHNELIIETRLL
jgi:hypothetical protein